MQTVRVFISSTFLDFTLERNILHDTVFPRVRELCKKHNCEFQAIDLRWGITEKESRDYSTLDICLEELKQCQRVTPRPNFLLLSGNRYGWRPLPRVIPRELFRTLTDALNPTDSAVLHEAYRQDENAVEGDCVLTQLPQGYAEGDLYRLLRRAVDAAENKRHGFFGPREPLSEEWKHLLFASATHHELLTRMALPDFEGGAICAVRTLRNVPESDVPLYYDTLEDGSIDNDAYDESVKVGKIAARLCPNTYCYQLDLAAAEKDPAGELKDFADYIYDRMEAHILSELEKNQEDSALTDEIRYHQAKMDEQAKSFRGRTAVSERAVQQIIDHEQDVLVITGEPSCGKSAFMAKIAQMTKERGKDICFRYVGLTGNASDLDKLSDDIQKERAAKNSTGGCVIFLDGVERAHNPAVYLREVLKKADQDTLLVLSMTQDFADEMNDVLSGCDIFTLSTLRDNIIEDIIDDTSENSGRRLTYDQKECLIKAYRLSGDNMHVFSILLKKALTWHSFDPIDMTDDGVRELIASVGRSNANLPGTLTRHMRLYLAAARDGLSSTELLGALSRDRDVLAEFLSHIIHIPPAFEDILTAFAEKNGIDPSDKDAITGMLQDIERYPALLTELATSEKERLLPYAYYSRALYDLMPALGEVLSQGQRVYVIERGLPIELPDEDSTTMKDFHSRLADYFALTDNDITDLLKHKLNMAFGIAGDSRKARELPYHYLKAERYDDLYAFLCDEQWLAYLYRRNRAELFLLWNELEKIGRYSITQGYARLLQEAERVANGGDPSSEKMNNQAYEALSALLGTIGGHQKEVAHLSDALVRFVEGDNPDSLLQRKAHKAMLMMEEERFTEALAYVEDLLRQTKPDGSTGYCDLIYAHGVALYRVERYEEAKKVFAEGMKAAEALGNAERRANMLKWIASCAKVTGHPDEADRIYAELEEISEKKEDISSIITMNYERATNIFLFEGDFDKAVTYIDKARKLAEERGLRVWLIKIYESIMTMYRTLNKVKEVEKYSLKYFEAWSKVNPGKKLPNNITVQYLVCLSLASPSMDTLFLTDIFFLMQECGPLSPEAPCIRDHRDSGLLQLLAQKCMCCLPKEFRMIIDGLPPQPEIFVESYDKGLAYFIKDFDEKRTKDFWDYQAKCSAAAGKMFRGEELLEIRQDDGSTVREKFMAESRMSFGFLWLYCGYDPAEKLSGSTEQRRDMLQAHMNMFAQNQNTLRSAISFNEYQARMRLAQQENRLYKELKAKFEQEVAGESELIRSIVDRMRKMRGDNSSSPE